MSDDVWKRPEVESPCVKVCMIHPETRLCVGCNRTGEEIARWSRMTPEERRAVMAELPGRGALLARRGARSSRRRRRPRDG